MTKVEGGIWQRKEKQAQQDCALLKVIGELLLCVQWKTLEDLNRKVMWITFFLKIILDFYFWEDETDVLFLILPTEYNLKPWT